MFGIAARRMGYRVHTYEPAPDSPAGQISDREFTGAYGNIDLVDEFVQSVDVVTFEFENIPAEVVNRISRSRPVHPRSEVLHICQNREREKNFLKNQGYPHAPFEIVTSQAELEEALVRIGVPAVLKTADFGYDGKGQLKIMPGSLARFEDVKAERAVLEKWIQFECELSVVCARGIDGVVSSFPVAENIHTNHILDYSIVPARLPDSVQSAACEIAESIAREMEVVGLIAVEFFLTGKGELFVNELAPRPHNSGHFTLDACLTSQFEQQLRAVCGFSFGSPRLLMPVVMVNLLGDLWRNGSQPDWNPVLRKPAAKLHLYGKLDSRPGRKMGHFCYLAPTVELAVTEALKLKHELTGSSHDS
jgi:5-(carboxyamino)imidazole ribonucleotide synthase